MTINVLLVCDGPDALKDLERGLGRCPDTCVIRAKSGHASLGLIAESSARIDLVVVDQSVEGQPGLRWVEQTVAVNPMVNTALVSELSDDDFHEYTEGLGVLMRIPPDSDETTATQVVKRLSKVISLNQSLGAEGTTYHAD